MPGASGASVLALADTGRGGGEAGQLGQARGGAGRWADLRTRALSAALLAPAALLCVWFGGAAWAVLALAAAVGLGLEWSALCGHPAPRGAGLAGPAYLVLAAAVALAGHLQAGMLVVVAGAGVAWALSRDLRLAAGVPYAGVPLVALIWLRGLEEAGRADVLFVIIVVWAADIGAYAVGRWVGGPKLAPAISPGKTQSGAVGGLLAAILVGVGASYFFSAAAGLGWAVLVATLLALASQAGDLFESWVKRQAGVKDSGRLIPGHGGLFDRLDGLLAAAPTAAALALWVGRGGTLWN